MHSKETEEIGWGGVGGSTAPGFPKSSTEIVTFGQYSSFTDIKTLNESIKVEKATGKFQIQVCDGTMQIFSHHQPRRDKIQPMVLPYKRLCGSKTILGGKLWTSKPNAASPQSRRVMVPFSNQWEGQNFHDLSRAGADVVLHLMEILKSMMNTLVESRLPTCL